VVPLALYIALFIIGLLLLIKGADWVVSGASSVASLLGVSAGLIALTIVAIGTTLPELTVSATASFLGSSDIALGNVVGSVLCNTALILGLAALIAPLPVGSSFVKREGMVMLLAGVCLWVVSWGSISRAEGVVLVALFGAYMFFSVRRGIREGVRKERDPASRWSQLAILAVGIICIVGGGQLLVRSTIQMAIMAGVPQLLLALTVVAIGTSLPEMAIAIMATRKGRAEIALGDVIGANILNIFLVAGVCSAITPLRVDPMLWRFDMPLMIIVLLLLLACMRTGWRISRTEGGLLLACYCICFGVRAVL